MEVKTIILAQGSGSRWKRYKEIEYKQLIPLGTETILTRTIRQVKEYSSYIVVCEPHLQILSKAVFPFITLDTSAVTTPQRIIQTYEYGMWKRCKRIIFLFGDVIYSNKAIKTMFEDDHSASIYGRLGGNKITGKHGYLPGNGESELFGLSVKNKLFVEVVNGLKTVVANQAGINKGDKLWGLWHIYPPYLAHGIIQFDDYTDDIDQPYSYDTFFPVMEKCALEDDNESSNYS